MYMYPRLTHPSSYRSEHQITEDTAVFELLGQYVICVLKSRSTKVLGTAAAEALVKMMHRMSEGTYLGGDPSKLNSGLRAILTNIRASCREAIVADIAKIRNKKKESTIGQMRLKEISTKQGRLVFLIELMRRFYDAYLKDPNNPTNAHKKDMYEVLWTIESLELIRFNAPVNEDDKKDVPALVYDVYDKVLDLIACCRKVREEEGDLVKFQLTEMSDSLPPLSKYSVSQKLDEWQKRTLRWIEAGKSVIICAPTSSGKTVLSSIVVLINKLTSSDQPTEGSEIEKEKDGRSGGGAAGGGNADEDDDAEIVEGEDLVDLRGDEEEEEEEEEDMANLKHSKCTYDSALLDRKLRREFCEGCYDGTQRVLFIVPSEPLVWQVAAYFSRLLKKVGDIKTNVAIVTEQMTYNPMLTLGVMPQVVVGTPLALESALSKCRGRVGMEEYYGKAKNDYIAGGFDHFDWVVYDEVHSLDGDEGGALQRIIRSMTCKFLALSATVGNAEELRRWMESVKGDQLSGVELVTVAADLPEPPLPDMAALRVTENSRCVRVRRTLDGQVADITGLPSSATVLHLKMKVAERWSDAHVSKQQLMFVAAGGRLVDLNADDNALDSYGLYSNDDSVPVVELRQLVNMITHEVRFINLQRFVWQQQRTDQRLVALNPLAAIETVEQLRSGALNASSLSMTPLDSYRLWEKIQKLYPREAVSALNPYAFFGVAERITLQRTKEYEDAIKTSLARLATDFPCETKELLYSFRLEDVEKKEFNMCDLMLDLKDKNMLPAVGFHVNAFDAITLFQQLLAGLELRQQCHHPDFYAEKQKTMEAAKARNDKLIKDCGGNREKLEMAVRGGLITLNDSEFFVDLNEPHPDFRVFSKNLIQYRDLLDVSAEMELRDGFESRDRQSQKTAYGLNPEVLKHALIRGLRRGIGLVLNGVSFHAYRRAVQKFASAGQLGVVISDTSLAFGVNMPFRTCVFCGEMNGQLTPLLAQQMQGRAGRRGLDTQGNIVYAGSRPSIVRNLMFGTIAPITGAVGDPPRYDTMALQGILSPRFVGWGRVEALGGRYLREFIARAGAGEPNYTFETSKKTLVELGFIQERSPGQLVPAAGYSYPILSAVWMLRSFLPQSILLGRIVPELHEDISSIAHDESKIEDFKQQFFAMLLMFVDRHACQPGAVPMHEHPYFNDEKRREKFDKWARIYKQEYYNIPADMPHLRPAVPPPPEASEEDHAPLDSTMLNIILQTNDANMNTMSEDEKQSLKNRIWHIGTIIMIFHNSLWVQSEYYPTICKLCYKVFRHVQRLMNDIISNQINFENISSIEQERRDVSNTCSERVQSALLAYSAWRKSFVLTDDNKADFAAKREAAIYQALVDNHSFSERMQAAEEPPTLAPNSWIEAFTNAVARSKAWLAAEAQPDQAAYAAFVSGLVSNFKTLSAGDVGLVQLSVDLDDVCAAQQLRESGGGAGLPWSAAVAKAVELVGAWRKGRGAAAPAEQVLLVSAHALQAVSGKADAGDVQLVAMCLDLSFKTFRGKVLLACSEGRRGQRSVIALLSWICLKLRPALRDGFPAYLKALYDSDVIEEDAVKEWFAARGAEVAPAGAEQELTAADHQVLRGMPQVKALVEWLDEEEEEDEEED